MPNTFGPIELSSASVFVRHPGPRTIGDFGRAVAGNPNRTLRTRHVAYLALVFLAATAAAPTLNAADVFLGNRDADLAQNLSGLRHDAWTDLLSRYVDDVGNVQYRRWHSDGTQELDRYLDVLSSVIVDDEATAEDRMAYWINAYNAVTIRGILREYPTTSIRNHTSKWFGYNIWTDLRLRVSDGWGIRDSAPSLDDIEHQILRPMGDFRIHFAIVCASKGCPWLRRQAYEARPLAEQLDAAGKSFFSRRENFSANGKTLTWSPIMKWFADDFGDTDAKRFQNIAPFLSESQRTDLQQTSRVEYSTYDWSLNESR